MQALNDMMPFGNNVESRCVCLSLDSKIDSLELVARESTSRAKDG